METPNLEGLITLIRRVAEVPLDKNIKANSSMSDLGIDSIHMMLVVSEIDAQFDVVLDLDQLYNSKTILDLHNMIVTKQK